MGKNPTANAVRYDTINSGMRICEGNTYSSLKMDARAAFSVQFWLWYVRVGINRYVSDFSKLHTDCWKPLNRSTHATHFWRWTKTSTAGQQYVLLILVVPWNRCCDLSVPINAGVNRNIERIALVRYLLYSHFSRNILVQIMLLVEPSPPPAHSVLSQKKSPSFSTVPLKRQLRLSALSRPDYSLQIALLPLQQYRYRWRSIVISCGKRSSRQTPRRSWHPEGKLLCVKNTATSNWELHYCRLYCCTYSSVVRSAGVLRYCCCMYNNSYCGSTEYSTWYYRSTIPVPGMKPVYLVHGTIKNVNTR